MSILIHKKEKNGFTLIEIMVAVSIFVIVAFIVTSTLLAILDASRRANKIRLIVDNMNFALDSMTVKMKFGSTYDTSTSGQIEFTDREGNQICYKRVTAGTAPNIIGSIAKCMGGCGVGGDCSKNITTSEISVDELSFYKSQCGGGCLNEEIVILVKASAEIKKDQTIDLDFQTAVSKATSN